MSDFGKYQETKNPLYVWQAIALALTVATEPVVPAWCLPYLRDTATRLAHVRPPSSKPHPFRKTNKLTIPAQVMKALDFSRQGKRNAFANLQNDQHDMAMAKPEVRRPPWLAKPERETTPPTERDKRARKRRMKRGKTLLA
jgi:hypothetical protein